jgi:cell division septation protein DedD
MLLVGVLVVPGLARASTVQQSQTPRSVTIPANGTVTLKVRGFCLDFGKPFPNESMGAKGLADAKIRQALNYSIGKGYTEGNPEQVQQAIWFLRDGQWHNEEHAIGQEIVDNATPANNPNDAGEGTSLADAVANGQASVTARFTPQTQDAFYGDGDAEVRNLTGSELRLFMPIGVVLNVPTGGDFQELVAYELATQQVEVQETPQVTAQPTITLQPTAEPTLTAVLETPTQAPASTEVPTPVPAPTPEPAPEVIPAAGGGDSFLWLALLAIALGFGAVIAGYALRHARV